MNKTFFGILILAVLIGCQMDDIKNTYDIHVKLSGADGIAFDHSVTISLLKGDQIIATTHQSEFTFSNLEEGANYEILPKTTAEGRNGLSTLDLVEVQKHLQGVNDLDLFQKIAADVNKDNVINLEDLEAIKNCIIASPKLYECPNYRFVSEEHDENSFKYVDRYIAQKLNSDQEVTFIPVKLGDLNGTIHH